MISFGMLSVCSLLRSVSVLVVFASCSYAEEKAQQVKERAASEARELKAKARTGVDEFFDENFTNPHIGDTRANRAAFHDFFDTLAVPDARNIYAYTDYIGIDYKVMFSFTCDTSSLARIIERKDLVIWKDDGDPWTIASPGLLGSWDFEWWNREALESLTPFYRPLTEDQRYDHDHIYLWYDSLSHTATYQQFSM